MLHLGKGSLVLSYGVTNSGKTYTILETGDEPGILMALVAKFEENMPDNLIRIRALEIDGDDLYCLRNGKRLQMWENGGTCEFVGGCEYEEVTVATSRTIIEAFLMNRMTAETNASRASSRSQVIFMVECGEYHIGVVDLSRDVSKRMPVFVLGKCIRAFRDGTRPTCRESKLTLALMEYFNPNYKIFTITHINRTGKMFQENCNVLFEYAAVSTKAKHINPEKNPSIMKSVTKDKREAIEMKEKRESEEDEVKSAERRHNQIILERYKCYTKGVYV